jgi:hypothetical protein
MRAGAWDGGAENGLESGGFGAAVGCFLEFLGLVFFVMSFVLLWFSGSFCIFYIFSFGGGVGRCREPPLFGVSSRDYGSWRGGWILGGGEVRCLVCWAGGGFCMVTAIGWGLQRG